MINGLRGLRLDIQYGEIDYSLFQILRFENCSINCTKSIKDNPFAVCFTMGGWTTISVSFTHGGWDGIHLPLYEDTGQLFPDHITKEMLRSAEKWSYVAHYFWILLMVKESELDWRRDRMIDDFLK